MKAIFYIGIISALLLAGSPMAAQIADNGFRSDNSGLVINNYYYNDYDYYFASRINRFHRAYAAFDYYSPVFTDTYFYTYSPFSWGISIYGRGGFGFSAGYAYRYPVNNYGWYDPYYGSSWYWGYDPYFYSYDPYFYSWYSPVIININIRNRWRPWYSGWYGHDRWYYGHNLWFNDYRPVYHTHNYYYNSSSRYYSRDINERKGQTEFNRSNSGGQSRRDGAPLPGSRGGIDNNGNRTSDNSRNGEVRRNTNPGENRGQGNIENGGNYSNNGNNGNNGNNNNSRIDGNNGNFDQNDNNRGNNGNNRNSNTDGNNGNFGNKGNSSGNEGKGRIVAPTITPERRIESTAPSRNQTSPRVNINQPSRTQSSTVRSTTSRVQVSKSSSAPASRPSTASSSRSGRSAGSASRSSSSKSVSRSSGSTSKSSSSRSSSERGKRR